VPRRKSRPDELQYQLLAIEVTSYSASIDAAISMHARERLWQHDNVQVYDFHNRIELLGTCSYPDERQGAHYQLTVYGRELSNGDFQRTLRDFVVRDAEGNIKRRKSRGIELPIYAAPDGIGSLEKRRGENLWNGVIWVAPQTTSDMLTLLTRVERVYVSIQEKRIGRQRWIVGLTLQTSDPADE
jgi:hypothetical protein